ncbi:MAG: PD40 domain-containing protein [Anaerolineales bacterium]|nr:PD40 domain-containing protein [Anaerolineales bacterium]
MNEVEQIHDEALARIVLGLVVIAVIIGVGAFTIEGVASPWFLRAVALLTVATITYLVRISGRVVVAGYTLVFQLLGLIAEIFLSPSVLTSFAPYLLIPLAVVAGILLDSAAVMGIIGLSILIIFLVLVVTDQFSLTTFGLFLPPALLALVTGLLISENRKYITILGTRLQENRTILKHHTRQMMHSTRQLDQLRKEVATFNKQLTEAKFKAASAASTPVLAEQQISLLFEETLHALDEQFQELESVIENVSDKMGQNGQSSALADVWIKIDHLKSLLINLDELLQIENGQIALVLEPVDPGQLLNDVAHITQGLAGGKNILVRSNVLDALPLIHADPSRLRQALLQILINAVKYTDQGLIELHAKLLATGLKITISDTGLGIDSHEMDLVFEKFGRASQVIAQKRQGVGLGLAIARHFIELHGGKISVSSVVGVGSEFYIELPLKPVAGQQPVSLPQAELEATLLSNPNTDETVLSGRYDITKIFSQSRLDDPNRLAAVPASSSFSRSQPPVSRMGPTYTRRFGLILLTLLLLIGGFVALLAFINGPVTGPSGIAVTSPDPSFTPTQPLDPTPTPTQTVEPSKTPASQLATDFVITPTLQPLPSPTLTSTSTRMPPTPSPLPTLTPSPVFITSTASISFRPVANVSGVLVAGLPTGQQVSYFDNRDRLEAALALMPEPNSRLTWSSSGQALLTSDHNGDRDIYLVNPTGVPINLTETVGDDLQPAWSPDEQQIAFSSNRTGNFEIYIINADGSQLTQLTTDNRAFDEWPVWSPDGRQIAFVSDRTGNVDLFVIAADGTNLRQLTDDPADDWPAAWSPDGRQLVFASERDGDWNLYVAPVTGGDAIQLTDDPGDERDPIWSPDGKTIAFTSNRADNWDIYTLPVSSGSISNVPAANWTQITYTPTDERYPSWFPAPTRP